MMRMDVAWCKANLADAAPDAAAKLDRMENLLKTTVAATRRIASDLRPLMLDDLGLVPALEWLVQNMSQRTGLACDFSIDDPAIALPPAHSTAVFRIVQEALTNIAKHAHGVARGSRDPPKRRSARDHDPRRRRRLRRRRSAQAGIVRPSRIARARLAPARHGVDHERARRGHDHRGDAPARRGGGRMIRVVIADDHTILREGLRQLLGAAGGHRGRRRGRRRPRGPRARAQRRIRRASAGHVDAGQERHRAHQAGQVGEAEAARARVVDARGDPIRGARNQGRRVRLRDQGQRGHAARDRDSSRCRRRRVHHRGGRRAAGPGRDARGGGTGARNDCPIASSKSSSCSSPAKR